VKIIAAHSKLEINDFMEFLLSLRIATEMYPTFREYSVENRMVRRVRFGSLADLLPDSSLMSASERIAVIQKRFFKSPTVNVRFHQ
jgi:hypothetical protein